MQWGTAAVIDRQALQHNCRRVRELAGKCVRCGRD
jgi:alanine racemase